MKADIAHEWYAVAVLACLLYLFHSISAETCGGLLIRN